MNDIDPNTPYVAIDTRSKQVIKRGTWGKRKRITRFADKRDLAYGAVITVTRCEFPSTTAS